ncbi:MAG: hypothetical protein H0W16_09200 [Actinobacteria bacterium]|nr:hypothetical protein [Actinomycetota bacterium]
MRVVCIGLVALLIVPVAGGFGTDSAAATKEVVRAWSARLNAYDNAGVARLFSRPAAMLQSGALYQLQTYDDLARWHKNLPCAGRIVSITVRGKDATAVFALRNGKNRRCDAVGQKVAAVFRVSRGKIRAWAQIPVPEAPGTVA